VTEPITPAGPPAEITHLVRERIEARNRHDWPRADALKAEIEAAGWRVTDRGNRTSVSPAAPATLNVDGEVRYGSVKAVPSLLDAPATATWTVVVPASEDPARLSRLLTALRTYAPAATQVVVVANDPSDAQVAALLPDAPDRSPIAGQAPEVIRTSTRLGYATALDIALHRAAGEFVLLADSTAWPTGDAMTPLAAALADPDVAAAGGFPLVAAEPGPLRPTALRREAADAPADATALEGAWLAFRRADYRALGPLDERFVTQAWLDLWWTLRLRAGAEPEGAEYVESAEASEPTDEDTSETADAHESEVEMPKPRRAVRLALPLERDDVAWPPDRSRLNRRNMYRVLDRFGWRDDLT
jgi:Glycosyl transferase family 2